MITILESSTIACDSLLNLTEVIPRIPTFLFSPLKSQSEILLLLSVRDRRIGISPVSRVTKLFRLQLHVSKAGAVVVEVRGRPCSAPLARRDRSVRCCGPKKSKKKDLGVCALFTRDLCAYKNTVWHTNCTHRAHDSNNV